MRKINEIAAQQLQLDLSTLRDVMQELPLIAVDEVDQDGEDGDMVKVLSCTCSRTLVFPRSSTFYIRENRRP